jgi:hypothetical protein
MKPALCIAVVSMLFGVHLAHAACPNDAVFLTFTFFNTPKDTAHQVHGYSLRANGATEPCQVFVVPSLFLPGEGGQAIAIDKRGSLHVAIFGIPTVDIFARNAHGNQAPIRSFTFQTNDLNGIGVDSRLNDFVLNFRPSTAGVLVAPNKSSGVLTNPIRITDPNIGEDYQSLAIDDDDNLVIAGYDSQGRTVIDTFWTRKTFNKPPLLRSITGDNTGLPLHGPGLGSRNNLSLAIDPQTEELFVYNVSPDLTQIQVSVFANKANGNVAPVRVISGPATGITGPSRDAAANKIAVSSDGRLFVSEPNGLILVFAPGAKGNVAPSQRIQDSTSVPTTQGGIAVRSAGGGQQNENDDTQ